MLTCSPKKALTRLALPAAALEVLMGVSYLFVIQIQLAQSAWSYFFYYLYLLLHFAITMAFIVLALYHFDRQAWGRGFATLGVYLGAICIKDLVGNLCTYAIAEGYAFFEALGIAALQTLLSSLLIEGGILALAMGLSYFFFLWSRPAASPNHEKPFDFSLSYLTRAQLFVIAAYGIRRLVTLISELVTFGREVFWMMTSDEILLIAWDFIFVALLLVTSYLLCYLMRRTLRVPVSPPPAPTPLGGITPKKKK